VRKGEREKGRKGEREKGRKGEREKVRKVERKKGRKGEREKGERKKGRKEEREGGREGERKKGREEGRMERKKEEGGRGGGSQCKIPVEFKGEESFQLPPAKKPLRKCLSGNHHWLVVSSSYGLKILRQKTYEILYVLHSPLPTKVRSYLSFTSVTHVVKCGEGSKCDTRGKGQSP
jgi:hypothetical protein